MKKRRRNPINWERQAYWFEAEGTKATPRARGAIGVFVTVNQDISRRDIVETLCTELKEAGFKPKIRYSGRRTMGCNIERVEEMKCYIEKTEPHYISEKTKKWAETFKQEIKRREAYPPRRKRITFPCP